MLRLRENNQMGKADIAHLMAILWLAPLGNGFV